MAESSSSCLDRAMIPERYSDNAVLGVQDVRRKDFYFVKAFRFDAFDGVVQILEIGNGIIADGCTSIFTISIFWTDLIND